MKFKKIFSRKYSLMVITIFITIYSYFFLNQIINNLSDIRNIKKMQVKSPVNITHENKILITNSNIDYFNYISIDNVPKIIIQAFLIIEDNKFYSHNGFDIKAIFRAFMNLIISGHITQGGSTITQQLARNFFLTPKKSFIRKIKEILLAIKIEQYLSKKDILELYLNKTYLGQNTYGIVEASRIYFHKTLDQLTLSEIAILAGLPKNPSVYNPIASVEKTKKRRNIVLKRMLYKNVITKKEYNKAINTPIINNDLNQKKKINFKKIIKIILYNNGKLKIKIKNINFIYR
ncbi:transglycosylase domain-containing protein [Enterobacteriaceae endosymbiont of Plateumaris braccata]|uniref:transglycosylase domain-containing protein n=1 Tax=Enterobacteriaceae endosymbiont of Plateumaris braccata TaxID=2675793 RepID=UPI00144921EE|nr:transglycosylase domain-containing protein [Enterobacteriaceae endosymbiont of Plateumaris braccata]QJC28295.1 hypothetical protein GJT80_01835 [Enterobacteriaceae endosymbiont of Plateumaris braccata]